MTGFFRFSVFQLGALGASTVIGLIAGSSFLWAQPDRAWNILIAGFLWVLLIALGAGLARAVRERIQRGEWLRCLALGCEMTFPSTTLYILCVALASSGAPATAVLSDGTAVKGRPDMLALLPLLYSITLLVAVIIGPGYMLTSPFGTKPQPETPPQS